MINFDFNTIQQIEFGLGQDDQNENVFHRVMVDSNVQSALEEMVSDTWTAMQNFSESPLLYEPSEKHSACEYLYLSLNDPMAIQICNLHNAVNLDIDQSALNHVETIFCYFAKLTDEQGRTLTALKRATQFKGILKSRLIKLSTDAMEMVTDKVFKLDKDFDLLIDNQQIHILRPSSFEFIGKLKEAILEAVTENVNSLRANLPFVQFDTIQEYASDHPRAARYLASIRSQRVADIDQQKLIETCVATGVAVENDEGMIVVDNQNMMGFLEVLDRRRYEVNLIPKEPEQYRAPSRTRIC